jgi:predicted nuclease of predicted toxin-antitoxin system
MRATFDLRAFSLRDIDMKGAKDELIFRRAKQEVDAILTKDEDFLRLVHKHGPPPSIIWVTVGNTSNRRMKELLTDRLPRTLQLIKEGNAVVEIAG